MEANYCTQYGTVIYQIIPDNNVPDNVGAPFSIDPTTVVYEVESKPNFFMKQCSSSSFLLT